MASSCTPRPRVLALRDRGLIVDGLQIDGAGELELSIRDAARVDRDQGQRAERRSQKSCAPATDRPAGEPRARARFDVDLHIAGSRIERARQRARGRRDDRGIGPLGCDARRDRPTTERSTATQRSISSPPAICACARSNSSFGREGPSLEGLKQASGQLELETKVDLAQLPRESSSSSCRSTGRAARCGSPPMRFAPSRAHRPTCASTSTPNSSSFSALRRRRQIEDRTEAMRRKPRRLAGMDFNAELRVIGVTRTSSLLARVHDKKGPLIDVQAETPLTVEDALAGELGGATLASTAARPESWFRGANCRSYRRSSARRRLPERFRSTRRPTGTLAEPNLALDFRVDQAALQGSQSAFLPRFSHPGSLRGAPRRSRARRLEPRSAARPTCARGPTVACTTSPAAKASSPPGRAMFRGLPLALVPGLRERQVRGKLFGDVMLTDLGKNAKAQAELIDERAQVRRAHGPRRKADSCARKTAACRPTPAVDHTGGFARAKLDAGIKWGDRAGVRGRRRAVRWMAELQAKNFRAAVLLPFVHDMFSELDGKLECKPPAHSHLGDEPRCSERPTLEDGIAANPVDRSAIPRRDGGRASRAGRYPQDRERLCASA